MKVNVQIIVKTTFEKYQYKITFENETSDLLKNNIIEALTPTDINTIVNAFGKKY
jgi:hypothetical protein